MSLYRQPPEDAYVLCVDEMGLTAAKTYCTSRWDDKRPHVDKPQNVPNDAEDFARPNDPLYLMPNTSAPSHPFPAIPDETVFIEQGEPMFTEWGEHDLFNVEFNGGTYKVIVRYSIAKNEARKGDSPGV